MNFFPTQQICIAEGPAVSSPSYKLDCSTSKGLCFSSLVSRMSKGEGDCSLDGSPHKVEGKVDGVEKKEDIFSIEVTSQNFNIMVLFAAYIFKMGGMKEIKGVDKESSPHSLNLLIRDSLGKDVAHMRFNFKDSSLGKRFISAVSRLLQHRGRFPFRGEALEKNASCIKGEKGIFLRGKILSSGLESKGSVQLTGKDDFSFKGNKTGALVISLNKEDISGVEKLFPFLVSISQGLPERHSFSKEVEDYLAQMLNLPVSPRERTKGLGDNKANIKNKEYVKDKIMGLGSGDNKANAKKGLSIETPFKGVKGDRLQQDIRGERQERGHNFLFREELAKGGDEKKRESMQGGYKGGGDRRTFPLIFHSSSKGDIHSLEKGEIFSLLQKREKVIDSHGHSERELFSIEMGKGLDKSSQSTIFREGQEINREEVLRQIERGIFRQSLDGKREMELQLHPPELGKVRITISVHNKEVSLVMRVEHGDVAKSLNQHVANLENSFEKQGLKLVKVDVRQGFAEENPSSWMGYGEHQGENGRGNAKYRWGEKISPHLHLMGEREIESLEIGDLKDSLTGIYLIA